MFALAPARKRLVTRRRVVAGALACLVCGAAALLALWVLRPLAFLDALDGWTRSRAGLTTRTVTVGEQRS